MLFPLYITGAGLKCEIYHAGLTPKIRKLAHENFVSDKVSNIYTEYHL